MSTLDRDSRYWKQGLAQSCKFLRPSGQSKKLGATVKKKSDPTSSESPTLSLFWLPCWCRQLESSLMGGSRFCTSEGLSSLRSGEEEDTCQQCFRGSRGAHLVNSCISGGLAEQRANWSTCDSHHHFSITWRHCLPMIYCLRSYKCQNLRLGSWEGYKRSTGYSQTPFYPLWSTDGKALWKLLSLLTCN